MSDTKELHFSLRVMIPAEVPDEIVMLKLEQILGLMGVPLLIQPALFESEAPDKEKLN